MRKKLFGYGVLCVLAVFLTACNSAADALVDYNNEFIMDEYSKAEQEYLSLSREYEKVVNESGNDLAVREEFMTEKVLPKSQQLLDKVKEKKFENEEVQEVHSLLVESEELRHQAIEKESEAIKADSEKIFNEATGLIKKSDKKKRAFFKKMDELAEEYNLEKQDD